jgi:uncharacterized heparinase superfamily protein
LWSADIAAAIQRAQAAAANEFCFLNRQVAFGERIKWHDPDLSQLWRYHLHYFDYVRDLLIWATADERDPAYRTFRGLARSWIDSNNLLAGDGWHPYTISLRVVNWLHAFSFFALEMNSDEETSDLLLRSAYGQVQVLFSNLELDVRGNHLMENVRALIWAGIAFDGSEARKWFTHGLRLLEKEVEVQVLSDGGHFERSPGYHLVVFKDLLEIALLLKRNQGRVPEWLADALQRMHSYLWSILAPDGNVPLLKDSAWDAAPAPRDLLAACAVYLAEPSYKTDERIGLYPGLLFGREGLEKYESWPVNKSPRPSVALSASGHYVMRDEEFGDHLILDAGKTCPDHLPAHAHADLLTYELTCAGERVVVDSGVYEYKAGSWRDYFRSTRAHNTVEVGGENQSEVWSSFRVGRRARPGPVTWKAGHDYVLVQGEHDGYRRLPVAVTHQRTIVYSNERFWLIADQLWGEGETTANNYAHLNPALSLEMIHASTWRITNSRVPLWLRAFGQAEDSIESGQMEPVRQGWYSERFGELKSNVVLTLRQQASLPICFGYVIAAEVPIDVQVTALKGGHEIRLVFRASTRKLRLVKTETPQFA